MDDFWLENHSWKQFKYKSAPGRKTGVSLLNVGSVLHEKDNNACHIQGKPQVELEIRQEK